MKNFILFILVTLFFYSCNLKKIEHFHGIHGLESKQEKLTVNQSNKNDIFELLGPPSTKGSFDKAVWIYIERITSNENLIRFGKEKIIVNNVLLLEINDYGILEKKDFLNINEMKNIEFTERKTVGLNRKSTFVYEFLSSMRQKINDPLGKRKRK
jgi:outer membrane protein assembly factor BamE (lipoprotein component of BamABCDE complex)